MCEDKVVMISSGLITPKKDIDRLSTKNLYLNYGLLGLSTIIKNSGYDVIQFQGEFMTPTAMFNTIKRSGVSFYDLKYPVFISVMSFLALPWCKEFCRLIKEESSVQIAVGGKYVVDGNVDWLQGFFSDVYIDFFICGDGINIIMSLLKSRNAADSCTISQQLFPSLDYGILENFKEYQPCIELGRGCGKGCHFCADGKRPVIGPKSPLEIVRDMDNIYEKYETNEFLSYFQFPTFCVNDKWIIDFADKVKYAPYHFLWRCTTRVDSLKIDQLKMLYDAGLRVIDLGLESASEVQLCNMNKTKNAANYLDLADKLLLESKRVGIWVKPNILFGAGETLKTIETTKKWLIDRKEIIKGVSVNTEIVFGPHNNIMNDLETYGASFDDHTSLLRDGYSYINPSSEISFFRAKELALELSKALMSAEDYYELKKYGYFSRSYSYQQFLEDIHESDIDKLPFAVDEMEGR